MQSRWAAELSPDVPDGPILELCAGAGHIGLLASMLSGRDLVQVEQSAHAADLAARNAATVHAADRVEVRCAPMQDALQPGETFPLIVADPPYLRHDEIAAFPEDPVDAIDGGVDGLDGIRSCLDVTIEHLADGGACLLQVRGPRQVDELRQLVGAGWSQLTVIGSRIVDPDRGVALLRRR